MGLEGQRKLANRELGKGLQNQLEVFIMFIVSTVEIVT